MRPSLPRLRSLKSLRVFKRPNGPHSATARIPAQEKANAWRTCTHGFDPFSHPLPLLGFLRLRRDLPCGVEPCHSHSPGKNGEPPRRQAPTLRMPSPAEHEHTLISCSKRLPGFPRLPGLSVLEFFKEKGGYSPFPAQTFVGNARAMTQPLHPRPRHWKLVQLAAPFPRPCITSTYRLPSPKNSRFVWGQARSGTVRRPVPGSTGLQTIFRVGARKTPLVVECSTFVERLDGAGSA